MDPSIISEEPNVQQPSESKYMRKRDVDAAEFERLQPHAHSQTHSKATQLELSHWFYTKFNKQINLQQWDPGMLMLKMTQL